MTAHCLGLLYIKSFLDAHGQLMNKNKLLVKRGCTVRTEEVFVDELRISQF